MKKLILIALLASFLVEAQTDTLMIEYTGFHSISQTPTGDSSYTILYDSTYYENVELSFLRVLLLPSQKETVVNFKEGMSYSVAIQRKFEHSYGCSRDEIRIRSQRVNTDPGTLFNSSFLEEQLKIAASTPCAYRVIEYYYVLDISPISN